MFKDCKFLLSATHKKHFPKVVDVSGNPLPQIAFVGRSNVGKSSLINHLTNRRKLAYISSKPGKTREINFFNIDDEMVLVDLPGYGFARVSKKERSKWGELTEDYLTDRAELKLIIQLIDSRHLPTKDDLAFASWAQYQHIPLAIVLTKTDKLPKTSRNHHLKKIQDYLDQNLDEKVTIQIPYSIQEGAGRNILTKEIEQKIKGEN